MAVMVGIGGISKAITLRVSYGSPFISKASKALIHSSYGQKEQD